MTRFTIPIASLANLLICALATVPALAQARVFVAAQGSDGNPCTFAQPCRTFQHAHNIVAAGGEINVLDPAGYGALTITKAVSVQGHGFAGISVPSGSPGIAINAQTATDKINLTGLIIDGAGVGERGIVFLAGGSLTVRDCIIRNLTGRGIDFHPIATSNLTVSDTLVSDNGGRGIFVGPTGATTVSAVFNRVEVYNNIVAGITLSPGVAALVVATSTDSVAAYNGGHGFGTLEGGTFSIIRSLSAYNSVGIEQIGDFSSIYPSQSTVHSNSAGLSGGHINSFSDNNIFLNSSVSTQTIPKQ
jgi:hypothetical protein